MEMEKVAPESQNVSDLDDIERYVATLTDAEREGLAAAEAAIDIAILLHRAREHRGLNQAGAARLAGLQQQAVSRFERPSANPRIETVRAYLGALGYALELTVIDLDTGEAALSMTLPPTGPKRSA
jgi:DNA-binding XRE family transcriptional regulator